MSAKAFRGELEKVMPGYKWTVHKSNAPRLISATGIRSSGFNRIWRRCRSAAVAETLMGF